MILIPPHAVDAKQAAKVRAALLVPGWPALVDMSQTQSITPDYARAMFRNLDSDWLFENVICLGVRDVVRSDIARALGGGCNPSSTKE